MRLLLNKFYLLIFLLVPFVVCSQTLRDIADSVRLSRGVPGLVYAVFTSDSILDQGACGVRKYRTKDSIRITDCFDIGLNTAAFTSYIAAKMVEEKKINWDTKLLDIFPDFKKKAFPVYKNLTLVDLLSNRTVVPLYTELNDLSRIPNIEGKTMSSKRRQFTMYMLTQKPFLDNFVSKKIAFSIPAYVMAASMLEKVAGKKWEGLVNDYINIPLKVTIKYGWPFMTDSTAPAGHWTQGNYFHAEGADTWVRPNPILYPAHHISINLQDYIKFMQENLSGLLGKTAHLKKETFEFLHFGLIDYALGWNNGALDNYSYSFHEGLSFLYNCRAVIIKEKNIGIVVMCNSGDSDGRGAVLNLTRILESHYLNF
ncbi:MAG: beta-lactamase family protein [Bacteroidetes bacterium]|nr:beta-lactamase family protein [Bacteroidota bacterium]